MSPEGQPFTVTATAAAARPKSSETEFDVTLCALRDVGWTLDASCIIQLSCTTIDDPRGAKSDFIALVA